MVEADQVEDVVERGVEVMVRCNKGTIFLGSSDVMVRPERIYAEARQQGLVASLLTEERPNVFTQKVANIEPGRDIAVELTYYNPLPFRDDGYVLTNHHVIAGARDITITLADRQEVRAKLVGEDAASDLAVLMVDGWQVRQRGPWARSSMLNTSLSPRIQTWTTLPAPSLTDRCGAVPIPSIWPRDSIGQSPDAAPR